MLDSKTDNNDIYKGLNELYKAGKYEETIENIQNCGIDLEEDPSLMNLKGACYTRLGEYEKAISSLMDTLSIDPDNKYALINLATIKFVQKSYQLSFNYYAKAAQDSEIEPRYLANMGFCLFKLDHFDDAVNLCEEAISIDPKCETAYFYLAEMMEEIEDPEASVTYYYKALEANPDSYIAYFFLGNYFQKLKLYKNAVKFYKNCVQKNPKFIKAISSIAHIMSKFERYKEEIFYLKKIIDVDNQNSEAFNQIGIALNNLENYTEANERFLDAIYLSPEYEDAYANLGNNLIKLGRLHDAYECLNKTLEFNTSSEKAYVGLDLLHLIVHDYFNGNKHAKKINNVSKKEIEDFLDSLNISKKNYVTKSLTERIYSQLPPDNCIVNNLENKISFEKSIVVNSSDSTVQSSKNIVALYGFGRSGSLFLHSLFDGHPDISTLPGYFFKGWFNEKTWPLLQPNYAEDNWREKLALDICNYFEPQFDANSKKNVIGKPNDHTAWFAQNLGFTQLGNDRSEVLDLDQDKFKNSLIKLLKSYSTINVKVCFELIHEAFHDAYRETTHQDYEDKTIFYHLHNPNYYERTSFNYYYPHNKSLFIVRHPIKMLESWINYELNQIPETLAVNASFENNYEIIKILQSSNKISYTLQYFINPLNSMGIVKGVKLEDIKNDPQKTLDKMCKWIGIKNDPTLYKSEFMGKQFSRPSINFDNITGFDKKSIDVPIGRLFGKRDIIILETLFWPFMNEYNYTQMSKKEFIKNLKIIRPWLEEPFEFEKDIHKKLPEDTPDLHEICSYQIPHRYLIKIWEILNETQSYPYLIEPLE